MPQSSQSQAWRRSLLLKPPAHPDQNKPAPPDTPDALVVVRPEPYVVLYIRQSQGTISVLLTLTQLSFFHEQVLAALDDLQGGDSDKRHSDDGRPE